MNRRFLPLILAALLACALAPAPASAQTATAAQSKPLTASALLEIGKKRSAIRFRSLTVKVPFGARISVACGPSRLCRPFVRSRAKKRQNRLTWMKGRRLRAGNRLVIRVTKPGNLGRLIEFRVTKKAFNKIERTIGKPTDPDTDGDGFADRSDKCAGQYGIAPAGCPAPTVTDRDGDGISDGADACPDKAGAPPSGCEATTGGGSSGGSDSGGSGSTTPAPTPIADRDGDGTGDSADACPGVTGSAALGGCPDSDGDGVRDISDACATQHGQGNAEGCPAASCSTAGATLKRGVFHDFHSGRRVGIAGNWTSLSLLTKSFGSAYDYPSKPFTLRSDGLWRIWIPSNNDAGTRLTFTYRVVNQVATAFCEGAYTITVSAT